MPDMPPVMVVFSGGRTAPWLLATLMRKGIARKKPPIMMRALMASE